MYVVYAGVSLGLGVQPQTRTLFCCVFHYYHPRMSRLQVLLAQNFLSCISHFPGFSP